MPSACDLTGQRFGKLVVVELAERTNKATRWLCQCDCGNTKILRHSNLGRNTNSCGCIRNTQGALSHKHPLWNLWDTMHKRCSSLDNSNYGGRGISVCGRWSSFQNFIADMGPRPTPKHTIERKNNDLGYSPDNCIWATPREQGRNRRTNHVIPTPWGEMTAAEAGARVGLPGPVLLSRIRRGWPAAHVFLPVKFHRHGIRRRVEP